MITAFVVDITKLSIDNRYYSFHYKVNKNGVTIGEGDYESDHSWADDKKGFRRMLKDGHAAQLAIDHVL